LFQFFAGWFFGHQNILLVSSKTRKPGKDKLIIKQVKSSPTASDIVLNMDWAEPPLFSFRRLSGGGKGDDLYGSMEG